MEALSYSLTFFHRTGIKNVPRFLDISLKTCTRVFEVEKKSGELLVIILASKTFKVTIKKRL